jgi:hypothetical protein
MRLVWGLGSRCDATILRGELLALSCTSVLSMTIHSLPSIVARSTWSYCPPSQVRPKASVLAGLFAKVPKACVNARLSFTGNQEVLSAGMCLIKCQPPDMISPWKTTGKTVSAKSCTKPVVHMQSASEMLPAGLLLIDGHAVHAAEDVSSL